MFLYGHAVTNELDSFFLKFFDQSNVNPINPTNRIFPHYRIWYEQEYTDSHSISGELKKRFNVVSHNQVTTYFC